MSDAITPDTLAGWLAAARTATLCTLLADDRDRGVPFGSVVPYAVVAEGADAGRIVVVISDLAVHTKNLRADPRASILVVQPGTDDVQAGWRMTLIGRLQPREGDAAIAALAAYHRRFPPLGATPVLHGFNPWILDVTSTRYIQGFGRMGWL